MLLRLTPRARTAGIALSATVFAVLFGAPAHALDWEFAPRIELGGVYNDNYLMSTGLVPEREVSGGRGGLALDLTARGQLTEMRLVPEIRATYFPDDEDLDTTDKLARFDWRRRGERSELIFDANWSDQTIMESETPTADAPDPTLGTSTVIGASRILAGNNRQTVFQVAPQALFDMTERTRLDVRANYSDVGYDETVFGNQVDYSNAGGSLGVEFEMTQRSSLGVRGIYDQYDPDEPGLGSDGYGIEALWRVGATERDQFYVMVGAQRTEFDTEPGIPDDPQTNFAFGIGAERAWVVTRLFVDAMYGVDPSGIGSVVERSQLNFRLSRDFSPRTTGRLGVLFLKDDPVSDDIGNVASREYASGLVGLSIRLSRTFALAFDYTYTWEDYDDFLGDAASNSVVVSLVYEPARRD